MLIRTIAVILFSFCIQNAFAAQQKINNGVLQAYWRLVWNVPGTISTPALELRYLVADQSGVVSIIMMESKQDDIKKIINKYFINIPKSFFEYKEGHVESIGDIIVDGLSPTEECGDKFSYANFISFNPVVSTEKIDIDVIQRATICEDSYPYIVGYTLKPDVKEVYLRKKPSIDADINGTVSERDVLIKIKTINKDWVLVGVYDSKGSDLVGKLKGYVELKYLDLDN
ncbi:SH3 domain-containing protein [Salmonella enterica subsp. enterica]|uniref:SH3 domain-containing protein n=1 Tax=Salmonella enterica TaxID=28901 RepID=UPI0010F3E378|nr:SH3 domain-containing protein [Salmonella enterica]EAA6070904.1 SH3 domain-containing protein [Salmonella enterica subsp. enterica serovar Corvallis]ECI3716594.1 SH3 domain-containing protein [Salmonella enterica subsp. enterica]EBW4800604.1 SH3 domain-containing protein [Salmonella enterica subsp. enterica serovar Corvallis]EBW6505107.1 SH3 domain-containing protein [Salmonella enterica subsp. enterica serovar Corvallis]EBX4884241.1 SH3 domain-containing protein [Salmonella enterica subsp.